LKSNLCAMTPITLFKRYVWLIDTIYSAGTITKEEIDSRWSRSSHNVKHESRIPRRTFFRQKEAIQELFGVNIACDKSRGSIYYIENRDEIDRDAIRQWLISTFSVNNLLTERQHLRDKILLEDIPSGQKYLTRIIDAIDHGEQLSITYQSFFSDEAHDVIIEPYCVKLFKQRWYVLGHRPEKDEFRVYALDRMSSLSATGATYSIPSDFDAESFFADYYGVILNRNVDTVVLRVQNLRAKYLCSLPLHHSQKVVRSDEQYTWLELHVAPTFDFIQEIRSLGNEVRIEAPAYLRDELLYDYRTSQELYNE